MNPKRLFSALLAVCLSLTLMPLCGAASSAGAGGASLEEAVQAVTTLGILSGDGSGDLGLDRRVTRAEIITLAIKASPGGDGVGQAAYSPYPDVPRSHWASGYVEAGVARGLISGYSDGTFRPGQDIKLAEGATIVLALLGYGAEDFSGAYPSGQMALYHSLRLDRGLTAAGAADPLTRQDAVYLFYNLLLTQTKAGSPYIQSLGYSLDASGKPDLVTILNRDMEGPIVARGSWRSQLDFTPVQVYRNGASAPAQAVQDYDVLYWNASTGTVWAYSQRASGMIQAIEPAGANPTSVTVAGRTYAIETSAAAYALSDLGQYRKGDSVTLLLGRSGGVAAVVGLGESAGERVGVAISVSTSAYPDGAGGTYTAQTVTLLASDGQTYEYQAKGNSVKEGSLLRASADAQTGEVVLRTLSSTKVSGTVDRNGTRLDSYPFAENVEILDVSGSRGAVITPERLAGLSLSRDQVRCCTLNSRDEIEVLILKDVTGDAQRYGILTQMETMGEDMSAVYSYEYVVDGSTYALPGSSTRFPVSPGPIQIVGDLTDPERLRPLTATKTGELVNGSFVADGRKYTLSDNVAVYERRNGQYYLSSLARAQQSEGTLTAWYDKAESSGGRVRVIVVK